MVLREHDDPLNQSKGIMGPLQNATGVQNNRGRLRQRFDLIRKLGQGTYGKVQLGIDKETGQEVAIKTIKKSKIETEADLIRIRREIQIMSSVRHPNIIHIYEVFENREKMVLVMEYAAGGELYDYLNDRKVLKEDEARRIFRQIASAVYYCHKNKICHRDLKLENILLDESTNAKIADFGLSNVFDNSHLLKTFCGSPLYASPEIVRGTPYCGPEVDCWSLGVLLYTLVYGAMPFDGSNFKRLVKQISNGDYYEPKKTAEASSLIKYMLTVDPLKRATIKDVCSNPWINQGFDQPCLIIAEELANATPVRLDILLSLSSPINANNVVIEKQGDAEVPSTEGFKSKSEAKIKTKTKKENGAAKIDGVQETSSGKPKTPNDAKKKQVVKKKSKSSPLLELIVDVEEENEREVEDEAGDTLSEISEIQTIAEGDSESKDKIKSKEKIPVKEPTLANSSKEVKPVKVTAKITDTKIEEPEKLGAGKKEVQPEPVEKPKVQEVTPSSKPVAKKKISKTVEPSPTKETKIPDAAPAITDQQKKVPEKVVLEKPEPKPEPKPETKPEPKPAENKTTPKTVEKSEIPEPQKPEVRRQVSVKTAEVTPKNGENKVDPKPEATNSEQPVSNDVNSEAVVPKTLTTQKSVRMKQRSDSTNSENTSPTRIERRNSKVISQKTAELIQNLETKTSTGQDSKGKKFVFPSLKVSDAKSKFECASESSPPKGIAPKPPSVSAEKTVVVTDKDKKANATTELKPKVPKVKSTSPSPNDTNQITKTEQTETRKEELVEPPKNGPTQISPVKAALEKLKEKAPAPTPTIVSKAPEVSNQKVNEQKIPPEPHIVNHTPEANRVLKLEKPEVDGTKSPRRSRSPRKPDAEKTEKIEPEKPATAISPKDKASKEEPESSTKPVVNKFKTQVPAVQQPNLKAKAVEPVVVAPETLPPRPPEPVPAPDVPSDAAQKNVGKEKLFTKMSQSKEQAAKKIGSVIQKIVSSESVDKGLESKKSSGSGLNKSDVKPAAFRTEIQQFVMSPDGGKQSANKTQRTEITFPVAAAGSQERIIPIKLVDEFSNSNESPTSTRNSSAASMPRGNLQRMDSAKSSSLSFSRQNSSETESSLATAPAVKNEPLKKSPREFIIPIKMESSGHTVTPKEEVLNSEASLSEDNFRLDSRLRSGRFGRQKRYSRLLSDSSVEDEPVSASVSASTSRRSSMTPSAHARSLSQGDEPQTPSTPGTPGPTFKRHRQNSTPLDRSDSCSSADEDEEDAFEVLTAESLFTSLLDRVRNLTKRLNRESSVGPSWATGPESPGFGLWGNNSPLQELMTRAPSETRHFISSTPNSTVRTYSREPSVTVTITTGPGWRQSLSREMSGESDSICSDPQSMSGSNTQFGQRNYSTPLRDPKDFSEPTSLRTLPSHLNSRRSFQSPLSPLRYNSHNLNSAPNTPSSLSSTYSPSVRPVYGRTLSNADYSTHSTLPLRRPIRAYDRSYTGRDLSSTNGLTNPFSSGFDSYSRSPSVASSRLDLSSRVESPSPNFPRYQPFGRTSSTPDPDSRINATYNSVLTNGPEPIMQNGTGTPVETNGWVGGATSSSTQTAAAKMTTQEKMNNYQNYYYNLNKHPTRRLDMLNPAANPNLSSRPSTMYETSFVDNSSNNANHLRKSDFLSPALSSREPAGGSAFGRMSQSQISSGTSNDTAEHLQSHECNGTTATSNSGQLNDYGSPSSYQGGYGRRFQSGDISASLTTNSPYTPTPRRRPPELALKQHRPFSISSFNEKPNELPSTSDLQPQQQTFVPNDAILSPVPQITQQQIASPLFEQQQISSQLFEQQRVNSPGPLPQPPPPKSDFNFVRNETARLTSPPLEDDNRPKAQTPKLKRDVRATSVEKITRFLERKSKPRELPPADPVKSTPTTPVLPMETLDISLMSPKFSESPSVSPQTTDKQIKVGNNSKISKPKFFQSLEKKWEKLTGKPDENTAQSPTSRAGTLTPEPNTSDNSDESVVTTPNESALLQRAMSPEKKPKSKFGANTVNFMLGKFRKMEENTKIPVGKPPLSSGGGVARRTPYAGARSDSILVHSAISKVQTPDLPAHQNDTSAGLGASGLANAKLELIKSIELAKQRENKATCQKEQAVPVQDQIHNSSSVVLPNSIPANRPTSLAIFNQTGDMSKSTSFIPRLNKARTGNECINGLPDIHVDVKTSDAYGSDFNADGNPTTPTSISDSFDSASVSSEKTEMSLKSSVLDDEESVSDRIFRKSFYSRFNSLDRKKPPTSSSSSVSVNRNNNSTMRSATTCGANVDSDAEQPGTSFSPRINKYNPNPLFKELITDEFKSNTGKKNDYSRRVTSKLSQLLSEIETDIKSSSKNREFIESQTNFDAKAQSTSEE